MGWRKTTDFTPKRTVESCGLLAWEGLPAEKDILDRNRSLTFVFEGGREITVTGGQILPDRIGHGFFQVELEMTTKH